VDTTALVDKGDLGVRRRHQDLETSWDDGSRVEARRQASGTRSTRRSIMRWRAARRHARCAVRKQSLSELLATIRGWQNSRPAPRARAAEQPPGGRVPPLAGNHSCFDVHAMKTFPTNRSKVPEVTLASGASDPGNYLGETGGRRRHMSMISAILFGRLFSLPFCRRRQHSDAPGVSIRFLLGGHFATTPRARPSPISSTAPGHRLLEVSTCWPCCSCSA